MNPRLSLHSATSEDVLVLERMLALVAHWRDPRDEARSVRTDPGLEFYLAGWPASDDAGLVATLDDSPVGAAWYRFGDDERHGYGYVDPTTAELLVAVEPEHRRRGIGRALMTAVIAQARLDAVARLSSSVEDDNPAILLYRAMDFVAVSRRENALTMRLTVART